MLTVRDLARDLELELLAGDDAADAPVRWVHISELPDPTPWLSGGELLLTTGMGLGDAAGQREYVERLADHGLAGLGFGVGFGHETVPAELVDAAGARGFPLFAVPYELPFIAVTERAFTQLVNEQYAVLRRSIAAHERLQRIVLSERGLDAIAGALSTLIGGAALVHDGRGESLAQRTFRRALDREVVDALTAELHERARRHDGRVFAPEHPDLGGRALALPVPDAQEARQKVPQAWLVAIKDAGALSDFDRLLLHQAVTVVALELLRRRVADTTERRLAGDLLSEVVAGTLSGPELARRLEPFGLRSRVSALVLQADERAVAEALREEATTALVARAGSLTCALLPGFPDDELHELGERVRARVGGPAGAGRAVPAGEARRAYHEARCALEALTLGNGHGAGNGAARLATARDLGSFRLLLALQDSEALRLFCDSLLGPIERGEGHYGGELMRSLEAFIEANGQWEAAARRLYCHRHTLRYRIRKIEELTGRDLGSARDRIEFWLAMRGRELTA
ncbi:MAG TPA: PucR family transcriptional regulator ligand-binding domain-containing protein [Solirubrobacteraceae bacterium]